MKNTINFVVFMVLVLVSSESSFAMDDNFFLFYDQYTVKVDLNQPVPRKIVLSKGQYIAFENNEYSSVSAVEVDKSGPMFHHLDRIRPNLVAMFRPIRSGRGKFTITYHVQAVGHKPQPPVVIEVVVPNDVVTVDVTDGFPKDIEILIGQRIKFISKKKMLFKVVDDANSKQGSVFERTSGNLYLAKPWGSYFEFDSVRKGKGNFSVETYNDHFDLLNTDNVSVSVK